MDVHSTPKRSRDQVSSVSDIESPEVNEETPTDSNNIGKLSNRQRKKMAKVDTKNKELGLDLSEPLETNKNVPKENKSELAGIKKQLEEINKKLDEVTEKQSTRVLKQLIKDTVNEMKEIITESLVKRIEALEGEIHDYGVENDKLIKKVETLSQTLNEKMAKTKDYEKLLRKKKIRESKFATITNSTVGVTTLESWAYQAITNTNKHSKPLKRSPR